MGEARYRDRIRGPSCGTEAGSTHPPGSCVSMGMTRKYDICVIDHEDIGGSEVIPVHKPVLVWYCENVY